MPFGYICRARLFSSLSLPLSLSHAASLSLSLSFSFVAARGRRRRRRFRRALLGDYRQPRSSRRPCRRWPRAVRRKRLSSPLAPRRRCPRCRRRRPPALPWARLEPCAPPPWRRSHARPASSTSSSSCCRRGIRPAARTPRGAAGCGRRAFARCARLRSRLCGPSPVWVLTGSALRASATGWRLFSLVGCYFISNDVTRMTKPIFLGLFPPVSGKWLAPQGPIGCAPGALLLANIGCLLWGWGLLCAHHTSTTKTGFKTPSGHNAQPQPHATAL